MSRAPPVSADRHDGDMERPAAWHAGGMNGGHTQLLEII